MVSCECLEDFILFDINMCSKLMEQILSTTYKIRNELHRLKVSFLSRKIWIMDQNEKNWIKNVDHIPVQGPEHRPGPQNLSLKTRTTKPGSQNLDETGPQNQDHKSGPWTRTKKFGPKKSGPHTGPNFFC